MDASPEPLSVHHRTTGPDYTERRRRGVSEDCFLELLQTADAIVWEADATTLHLTFVSQGAEKILGFSPEEWLATSNFWADHLHPEDRERGLSCEQTVRQKGQSLSVEYRMEGADGRFRWFRDSMHAVKGPEGSPRLLRGIMLDITKSKEWELALQASEERYHAFLANSTEGIWRYEGDQPVSTALPVEQQVEQLLRFAYLAECNDALARMYGFDRAEEMIGQRLKDRVGDDPRNLDYLRAFIGSGYRVENVETSGIDRRGKVRHFVNSYVGVVENGYLVRAWGVQRDVTERKQAEDALRRSEQLNREIISNAQEGLVVYDREFRYVVWNPFMEQLTGMPAEQVLGKVSFDLFPHLRDSRTQLLLQRALKGETVQPHDIDYRVAETGKAGWISVIYSPHFGLKGEIVGVIGIVREITKRREAEEALRESESILRLFVRHSPAAIAMLDRDMRYLVVSRRWISDYRLPNRDLRGLSHYEVFPETPEHWKEVHRRCLAGAVETSDEDAFPRQDGTLDWVRWESRPWRRTDGSIGGIIIFSEIITERKRTQEELQRSLDQLRALAGRLQSVREEERQRVAREIHDIPGQALTAIKLDLRSLILEMGGDPRHPPKRAASILNLVDETIQSVRRISAELRPGILDDLGLAAAIEWAGEDFEARTGTKCRLEVPPENIAIESERATAIFRILQEILTNVVRHSAASQVEIKLEKKAEDLILMVQDNGKGMPAEKLSSRKSLGMVGMQERALVFGGEVMICSAPGMGTTVRVRIPEACRT